MAIAVERVPLTVSLDFKKAEPVLTVCGVADRSNISQLTSILDRLAEEQDRCVSLDMTALGGMDEAALAELVRCAGGYRDRSSRLRLARPSEWLAAYLDRMLIADMFCTASKCRRNGSDTNCENASRGWTADVFTLPSLMVNCRTARVRVAQAAEAAGFGELGTDDISMAVGEAVTNAVQHGQAEGVPNAFTVSCFATAERFCVSVTDSGSGFDPKSLPNAQEVLFEEQGRGILCMRALMDELSFEFAGGTTARMVKFRR